MVYFARVGRSQQIKIGCTVNIRKRLVGLETHYGRPVRLLRVIEGGLEVEAEMHKRFDRLRHECWHNPDCDGRGARRPELFHPRRELMEFIQSLPEIDPSVIPGTLPKLYRLKR
jgi:hypothetical protein